MDKVIKIILAPKYTMPDGKPIAPWRVVLIYSSGQQKHCVFDSEDHASIFFNDSCQRYPDASTSADD